MLLRERIRQNVSPGAILTVLSWILKIEKLARNLASNLPSPLYSGWG
jgi:hypothetical protein